MKQAFWLLSAVLAASGALATAVSAQDLTVGNPAPGFTLPGTDGKTYSTAQLKGHWVVLAWFPKAFSGG